MTEMHLRQTTTLGKPGITYGACETLTTNKQRIQKFKETQDSRYIYLSELGKVCFQHNMASGDFQDLPRRTVSDKVLHHKAFNFAENRIYDVNLLRWFINLIIKIVPVVLLKPKFF